MAEQAGGDGHVDGGDGGGDGSRGGGRRGGRRLGRREFLAAVGAGGALGAVGVLGGRPEPVIDVRFWLTEQAATYDNLQSRILGYVRRAFEHSRTRAAVDFGGTVAVPHENAYELMMYGRWPLTLVGGATGLGSVDPVDDVNLLVTDSSIDTWPSGAGAPHAAAVGGAALLRQTPPPEEVGDVVDDYRALRGMQILLHECGHALGLKHDHGSIILREDEAVVSPMVSGYAWETGPVREREFDFEHNRCGEPYRSVEGKRGRLLMRFAACEAERIESYDGGLLP